MIASRIAMDFTRRGLCRVWKSKIVTYIIIVLLSSPDFQFFCCGTWSTCFDDAKSLSIGSCDVRFENMWLITFDLAAFVKKDDFGHGSTFHPRLLRFLGWKCCRYGIFDDCTCSGEITDSGWARGKLSNPLSDKSGAVFVPHHSILGLASWKFIEALKFQCLLWLDFTLRPSQQYKHTTLSHELLSRSTPSVTQAPNFMLNAR